MNADSTESSNLRYAEWKILGAEMAAGLVSLAETFRAWDRAWLFAVKACAIDYRKEHGHPLPGSWRTSHCSTNKRGERWLKEGQNRRRT